MLKAVNRWIGEGEKAMLVWAPMWIFWQQPNDTTKKNCSRDSNLLGQSEKRIENQRMTESTFWRIRLFQIRSCAPLYLQTSVRQHASCTITNE